MALTHLIMCHIYAWPKITNRGHPIYWSMLKVIAGLVQFDSLEKGTKNAT